MAVEKDHAIEDAASYGFLGKRPRDDCGFRYLIVCPENGGIRDLLRYTVRGDIESFERFLETNYDDKDGPVGGGVINDYHRWVILVSIVIREIIAFLAKPME